MSIESLLLLIALLALPLIKIFRAPRQRQQQGQRESAQRPPVPVPRPRHPTTRMQIPPEPPIPSAARDYTAAPGVPVSTPPTPSAVRQNMSTKIAPDRRLTRRKVAAKSLLDTTTARRRGRASEAVLGTLRSADGLNRAMVVTAIFGPCRAMNPHGWRESDGLR